MKPHREFNYIYNTFFFFFKSQFEPLLIIIIISDVFKSGFYIK